MSRPLKTQLGKAYHKCKNEASAYGECVERGLEGRAFGQGVCGKEYDLLRHCLKSKYHPLYQKDTGNPWASP